MAESDPERAALVREVRQLRDAVRSSEAEARLERERAALAHAHEGQLEAALREAEAVRFEAVGAADRARADRDDARTALRIMEESTVWRATAPLRRMAAQAPGALRLLRSLRSRPVPVPEPAPAPESAPATAETVPKLPPMEPLAPLPQSEAPVVSIVICAFGLPAITLDCLRSLAAAPPVAPAEVILVDDAAPPDPVLDRLHAAAVAAGARLLRNDENLGYLRSCNRAAAMARGSFIHFLNNDTVLWPGAVDALLDVLAARPDAALAGSKLLFPDGTLQEAGGIVWADGSAWNYGRHRDRTRPEYNYVREADYCSGASLMARRSDWEAAGGFDEAFRPAYCEDSDLSFRLRAEGRLTLYAPRSVVLHQEGASHGTDMRSGLKAHQPVNMARMAERWGETLRRDGFAHGTSLLRARDRARGRTVALVMDHYPLRGDRDAGSRALLAFMRALRDSGWVVKYWPENQVHDPVYTPMMEADGIEVIDQRAGEPFVAWLERDGMALDHVIVARPETAVGAIGPLLRLTRARLSYFGHDLHFARMRAEAALTGDAALVDAADRMERLERHVWGLYDRSIYLSEDEASVVRDAAPGTVAHATVPFSFEIDPARTAAPASRTLLFVAGFAHAPNVDAARFLVEAVLPRLDGSVRIVLAGSAPTDAVRALASERVVVTGFVTDAELASLYRESRVAVVPLRFGAGVKGKVVEALSRGLPLVTTPVGAQGIDGLPSIVPVRDDAAAIAAALTTLLDDDAAWLQQSHRQSAFAAERFSREALRRSVLLALGDCAQSAATLPVS